MFNVKASKRVFQSLFYYPFMKKLITYSAFFWSLFCLLSFDTLAQTRVAGKVTDEAQKGALAGISIAVRGKVIGTITDQRGNFSLTTNTPTPFTIAVSGVGFQTQEFVINGDRTDLNVSLKEQVTLGQEVVVSASRVEESVLKSPVSVERLDIRSFQATPSATFYDALQNIKGVDMSTQSLTFKSVNVRGFGSNGNTRVVQLLDGMDNQAPGLNFSVGNIAGVSELDLESVELLPGAASALYGPNAVNGLLLMTSKSPFQYQGLSAYAKAGVMSASNRSTVTTPFYDAAFRYAKAFNNKVAFKVGVSYLSAKDWQATDYRDQSFSNGFNLETGNRANNTGYDGVNIYGDASANLYSNLYGNGQPGTGANGTSALLGAIATTQIPISPTVSRTLPQLTGLTPQQIFNNIIPNLNISRTGYEERDLVNYDATNLKLNGALHYRLNENVEAILQANWGTGTTVYTGADRYYIKGFKLGQYKLELRGSNFFVRAYTTQERSGDAYATATLGQGLNEAWSGSAARWFPTYFGNYGQEALRGYAGAYLTALGAGQAPAAALAAAQTYITSQQTNLLNQARGTADQGRYLPGTPEFQRAFDAVAAKPIPGDANGVGARFLDKTNLYHGEVMYNLSKQIDPKTVELIVGGNIRRYALNSEGTLFARDESGKEFTIDEYGAYVQASKTIADILKLTGSVRYNKNQNFKAQVSPRLSAVLTLAKVHNFRASFQRGFRIPTTQDQYINLNTPSARLIGGLPFLKERFNFSGNPTYTLQSVQAFGATLQQGGSAALPQALTQLKTAPNPGYDPERVETYEVGYKGLLGNKLFIDAYYYYNRFLNFLGTQVVVQGKSPVSLTDPVSTLQLISGSTRNVYSYPVNSPTQLKNAGWAIGVDYLLPANYTIGANVSSNFLMDEASIPAGFVTFFNTPKYRYNLTLGNRNIGGSGFGFNVVYRAQDSFLWEGSFGNTQATANKQTIIPAYSTLDAQVSKKLTGLKSILKVGGTNLTGKLYTQAWGNPSVGSMYYVSLTFDQLLN